MNKKSCAAGVLLASLLQFQLAGAADASAQNAAVSLSAAQLEKIRTVMAQEGEVTVTAKFVSDHLGVTRDLETVIVPAMAVRDDQAVIHQFQLLPDDRGVLLSEIRGDTIDYYWIDGSYALISAMRTRAHQISPLPRSEATLQARQELGYWAQFADTH